CREIAGEIAAGRDCVNRMHFLADPQPFHQLLSELQSAIDLTLSERKKMREFLSGLRKRATKSQN
ncbi:hypothetical protein KGQ71_03785, partial [Patescibacteria group bacterium]|nr:hypothetical protein [Patescibacteria group bacterium]